MGKLVIITAWVFTLFKRVQETLPYSKVVRSVTLSTLTAEVAR
jgi:hypothetical protein